MSKQRSIPAGEFKAKCLKLMDEVARDGGELVITKRGKAVAKLVPANQDDSKDSAFGCMAGTVKIHGDIIGPFHEDWEGEPGKDDFWLPYKT